LKVKEIGRVWNPFSVAFQKSLSSAKAPCPKEKKAKVKNAFQTGTNPDECAIGNREKGKI